MRRFALAALAALFVAGCGTTSHPRAVAPECHPRTPPAAGECIATHFGIHRPTAVGLGAECADISVYQGYRPNLSGLRCVIIQSNYGLHQAPALYSQIRDANEHHIPWGAYTFMEGYAGNSEADLAVRLTDGHNRTLGVWGDAEINAAYSQACRYADTAKAAAFIAGIYSSPGIYGGGHCQGYLWPAEWGRSTPYPFAGYPSSAIKLHQFCGTCHWNGVEIDLDRDYGVIALSHS